MYGYWTTESASPEQKFTMLKHALRLRDNHHLMESLTSDPDLCNFTDTLGNTLLHYAAKEGCDIATFNYLLKKTANINHQNTLGLTPLHYLAITNRTACLKLFLNSSQLEINITNSEKESALYLAAVTDSDEALKILIEHPEIDLSLSNKQEQSPLHAACLKGHVKCMLALMKFRADTNAKDSVDRTPLHYFAQNLTLPEEEKIQLLTTFQCFETKFMSVCQDGFTPDEYAESVGHEQLAKEIVKLRVPSLFSLCAKHISQNFEKHKNQLSILPQECKTEVLYRFDLLNDSGYEKDEVEKNLDSEKKSFVTRA